MDSSKDDLKRRSRHKTDPDTRSRRSDREKSVDDDDKYIIEEKHHRRSDKEKSDADDDDKYIIEEKHHRRSDKEKSDADDDDKYIIEEKHQRRSDREKSVDGKYGSSKEKHHRRSDSERTRGDKDRKSRGKKVFDNGVDKHRVRDRDSKRDHHKIVKDSSSEEDDRDVKDLEISTKKVKERERRDRERPKEGERENREREKAKERARENRERAKEKEREEREKERAKKERAREDREIEKAREKEKERLREKEKLREREKEKKRKVEDSSDENNEHVRDHHDRKRHRRERDDDDATVEKDRGQSRRHKNDGATDDNLGLRDDAGSAKKENETVPEADLEEEQRRLDDEMDKRRRRVQEWQELKRKKEEADKTENAPKSGGKAWTLDGESDDDQVPAADDKSDEDINGDAMEVDTENETSGNAGNGNVADVEEEIDPLDAFMNFMVLPEVDKLMNHSDDVPSTNGKKLDSEKKGKSREQPKKGSLGRIIPGEDSDSDHAELESDEDKGEEDENDDDFMKRVKKTKAEKLLIVDHSKIDYEPFKKNFYIEVKKIARMTSEEVVAYRKELEIKIHGKDVPNPIKTWHQTGLTSKVFDIIKKLNYEKPMPIQAQALPIIMSGRDCIGVAKTGSGKTLAFVLPMLRHIKDQKPVEAGHGPIALVMAPTRELVQQIHSDIRKFARGMNVRCVPVYGGAGVAHQISELKRGTEIVVCTPGRMIDILCTSSGKITNLRRVTFFVMDEADRMFDMGFEPQITRIVQNTRPDRQTVLFSATFPRQVEVLARKVLSRPVEIQVGGRSVVNKDIAQLVEVRPENERFFRLLELLGEWSEKGKMLIFVHSQERCDSLFKDLIKHGYPCLSLHGAKDQTDRESTISDFKTNVCNLLIATSIAARGLDVKDLELVVNYDVPNHYEDYVHRVGRTGRAGKKGCAITFISKDDARYAPDLVKALELCEQTVPDDLKALADGFMAKVNQGLEQAHGTGYGGSGFKFNEEEDEVRKEAKKAQAKVYGFEEDKSDSEDEDDSVRKAGGDMTHQAALAQIAALAAASKAASAASMTNTVSVGQVLPNGGLPVAFPGMPVLTSGLPGTVPQLGPNDGAARAAALAAAMNLQHNLAKIQADAMPEHYEAELEINEFPQNARWKVTHKENLGPIADWTGASITTRGQFYPPGRATGPGERKLYLFIEGPTEKSVKKAKAELKRVLEDFTTQPSSFPGGSQPGRYSVV